MSLNRFTVSCLHVTECEQADRDGAVPLPPPKRLPSLVRLPTMRPRPIQLLVMTLPYSTRFVEANGLRFEVLEAGEGERLVLCLHGFPEHAHSFRHQFVPFANLGYRVWAPNLRGYGHSSRPPRVHDYAIEYLLRDVAGLIDAANATEVILVGHDWGAIIAWYFAMRGMRPLSRLIILNAPHPALLARELRHNPIQRRKSWYGLFFQLPWLPEIMLGRESGWQLARMIQRTSSHPERYTEQDIRIYRDNVNNPRALTAMVNYYRALVGGGGARRQAREDFPGITVPVLVVWGEADMALEKSCTYGTDAFAGTLSVRYLPGISHWVQQDAPDLVNKMICAFLTNKEIPHAPGIDAFSGDIG